MNRACHGCGCSDVGNAAVHTVVEALADDDLDRAMALGLMTVEPCPGCSPDCREALAIVRASRAQALAARERFRNRQARLQRLAEERKARREASIASSKGHERPPLPGAAAAALARAKARAAKRGH